MKTQIALLSAAVLGAAWGAPAPKPCTSCPKVAGTYNESIMAEPASASSCGELTSGGGSDMVTVTQSGSSIQIFPGSTSELQGTLNSDNSVSLGAVAGVTFEGNAGTIGLAGNFTIANGVATGFEGQYNFFLTASSSTPSCSLSSPVTWSVAQ